MNYFVMAGTLNRNSTNQSINRSINQLEVSGQREGESDERGCSDHDVGASDGTEAARSERVWSI